MSGLGASSRSARRRRADAERSIAAILDAAAHVLGGDPNASMDQVAKAAGISRQTVYAHFPSRKALITALTDRATERVLAELDTAGLDDVAPSEGLVRLMDIAWQSFESEPFLLQLPAASGSADEPDRHAPVMVHLDRLIRRGRRQGDFAHDMPVSWMLAATIALGHAAGEEVRAGRMSSRKARAVLEQGLTRLFAAR